MTKNIAVIGDTSGIGRSLIENLLTTLHTEGPYNVHGYSRVHSEGSEVLSNASILSDLPGDEESSLKVIKDFKLHSNYKHYTWDISHVPTPGQCPFDYDVHTLVLSAATNYMDYIGKLDMHKVMEVVQTNMFGWINVLNELAASENLGTRIILISSVAAYTPMRMSLVYNASKAAHDMMVKQCAREFGTRFPVVGVRPGYIEGTRLANYAKERTCEVRNQTPEYFDEYQRKISLIGRYVSMDSVVSRIKDLINMPTPHIFDMTGSYVTITGSGGL